MKLRYRTVRILEENPFSRPYLARFGQRDRRNAKGLRLLLQRRRWDGSTNRHTRAYKFEDYV